MAQEQIEAMVKDLVGTQCWMNVGLGTWGWGSCLDPVLYRSIGWTTWRSTSTTSSTDTSLARAEPTVSEVEGLG